MNISEPIPKVSEHVLALMDKTPELFPRVPEHVLAPMDKTSELFPRVPEHVLAPMDKTSELFPRVPEHVLAPMDKTSELFPRVPEHVLAPRIKVPELFLRVPEQMFKLDLALFHGKPVTDRKVPIPLPSGCPPVTVRKGSEYNLIYNPLTGSYNIRPLTGHFACIRSTLGIKRSTSSIKRSTFSVTNHNKGLSALKLRPIPALIKSSLNISVIHEVKS